MTRTKGLVDNVLMSNSDLQLKLRIFEIVILNTQNEKTVNPAKPCVQKIYVHEKILPTQNCRRRFIKNLLPEKRKENV